MPNSAEVRRILDTVKAEGRTALTAPEGKVVLPKITKDYRFSNSSKTAMRVMCHFVTDFLQVRRIEGRAGGRF